MAKKTNNQNAAMVDPSNLGTGISMDNTYVVDKCPTFTLRADRPRHLRALIAALGELHDSEMRDGMATLREWELWEERHR